MTQTATRARAARQLTPKIAPPAPRRDTAPRRAAADQARIPAAPRPDPSRVPVHPENAPPAAWPTPIQRCGIGSSCDCPPEEKLAAVQRNLEGAAGDRHVVPAHYETPIVIPARERASLTAGPHPAVISMLGAGRPLTPSESRAFPGWSGPLGNVRIHDDLQTQLVAAMLGDAGFAAGQHVGLGHAPGPAPDRLRLLAHELTHVMQQRVDAPRPLSSDPEREAEHLAGLVAKGDRNVMLPQPAAAPPGLAEAVIARYTRDLPGNLLLVIDVDDGDFVGGCVRAIVPHLGVKVVLKGVPKGAGNQLLDIHVGVTTNAAGETCFFFYESMSGLCEMTCFPTLDELKKRLREIRDWLKDKIEKVLRVLLPVAAAALLAYLIADAIIALLAAIGIVALA